MLVRGLTHEESADPVKRQFVDFWNAAHALEQGGDVRLGIWKTKAPKVPAISFPSQSAAVAIVGWPTRSRFGMTTLPLSLLERDPTLLGTGSPKDVVLARRSLPNKLVSELATRFSYRARLENQEDGWWFLEGKPVPRHAPARRDAIALLPEAKPGSSSFDALVLVEVDDYWAVLSERALRVYTVGAALDDARPVQFAQWKPARVVWDVVSRPSISLAEVTRRFGRSAAERAIPQVKSIIVSCTRST
jgi:hypothetical protein